MRTKAEARAALIERIKHLRKETEETVKDILDCYMAEHNPSANDTWAFAERTSIEVDTWSERKKRMTYDQEALKS